jgi:hypothetical protein
MEDDSSMLKAGDCIADNLVEDDLFVDGLGVGKDAVDVVSTARLGFLIFFLSFPATMGDMIPSSYFLSAACPADVAGTVDTGVNDLGAGDLGVDAEGQILPMTNPGLPTTVPFSVLVFVVSSEVSTLRSGFLTFFFPALLGALGDLIDSSVALEVRFFFLTFFFLALPAALSDLIFFCILLE